jgi:hypothetical protein
VTVFFDRTEKMQPAGSMCLCPLTLAIQSTPHSPPQTLPDRN